MKLRAPLYLLTLVLGGCASAPAPAPKSEGAPGPQPVACEASGQAQHLGLVFERHETGPHMEIRIEGAGAEGAEAELRWYQGGKLAIAHGGGAAPQLAPPMAKAQYFEDTGGVLNVTFKEPVYQIWLYATELNRPNLAVKLSKGLRCSYELHGTRAYPRSE